MLSALTYGRCVARALLGGLVTRQNREFGLVTASCGVAKHVGHAGAALGLRQPAGGAAAAVATVRKRARSYGDDAFFVVKHRAADVLGVADGVGGWRDYGVDPSRFAASLMHACERVVSEGRFQPDCPVGILMAAYRELHNHKQPLWGSSTACVVVLDRTSRRLFAANLGDSGFVVVRAGVVVHRSNEQQHYFNTPYQLAIAPPEAQNLALSDSPDMADSSWFSVELGDVIVTATDGLFDNLPDYMILDELRGIKDSSEASLRRIAENMAQRARRLAYDPNYMSPFARSACDNGLDVTGGKPDDITVLLSVVTEYAGD